MTTTAISTIAITNSNIAIAQAETAKRIACEGFVNSYNATGATVEMMQRYAECVNLLHPTSSVMPDGPILKIAFLIVLAAALFGLRVGWQSREYDPIGLLFYPFIYGGIAAITMLCFLSIVTGFTWVLS